MQRERTHGPSICGLTLSVCKKRAGFYPARQQRSLSFCERSLFPYLRANFLHKTSTPVNTTPIRGILSAKFQTDNRSPLPDHRDQEDQRSKLSFAFVFVRQIFFYAPTKRQISSQWNRLLGNPTKPDRDHREISISCGVAEALTPATETAGLGLWLVLLLRAHGRHTPCS